MKSKEFITRVMQAVNADTVYLLGGLMSEPLTDAYIDYKENQYSWNMKRDDIYRKKLGYFGTDCICFIKSIIWGWTAENPKGMKYQSNGLKDIGCDQTFEQCTNKSSDFSNVTAGEFVWQKGHIGVYVGDGLVAECTYSHSDGVQLSACNRDVKGYWRRNWEQHGFAPWIDYSDAEQPAEPETKTLEEIADDKVACKKGDKGEYVRELQTALIAKGFSCGNEGADGSFGANTEAGVISFQKAVKAIGQKIRTDGVIDFNTLVWLTIKF